MTTPTIIDIENIDTSSSLLYNSPPSSPSTASSTAESVGTATRRWNKVKRILYEFQFAVQALLSLGIVLWCILALSLNWIQSAERVTLYTMMAGILAYWMPAPKLKQDVQQITAKPNINNKQQQT